RMLIDENRWRAQRYGFDEGLVDFGRRAIVPYADLLEEIIALVAEDAAHFGCAAEIAHARTILTRGTSAHAQRRVHEAALAGGASKREALEAVVDWLIGETRQDLWVAPPPRCAYIEGRRKERQHGRQDPHRARSRDLPPPRRASARAYRRAEHRPDEPRRLLPQLPVEMVPLRSRRARHRSPRSPGARDRLRHAVRGMEGEIPEGSERRPEGGDGGEPQALTER